jgi:hypothetical protein
MKRKLSKLQLLSELRKLLSRPDTKIKLRKQKICGTSKWLMDTDPEGNRTVSQIEIALDPRRDGRVRLVIHELLHVWMMVHYDLGHRMVYELEEEVILSLEKLLYLYLHRPNRARELENWDRAIMRKLES